MRIKANLVENDMPDGNVIVSTVTAYIQVNTLELKVVISVCAVIAMIHDRVLPGMTWPQIKGQ